MIGNLDDPRSLPPAFKSVQDLSLPVPNGPRTPQNNMNTAWAAREAAVKKVARLSANDAPTHSRRLHTLSDRELQESGTS